MTTTITITMTLTTTNAVSITSTVTLTDTILFYYDRAPKKHISKNKDRDIP